MPSRDDQVRVELDLDELFREANELPMLRAKTFAKATQIANRARRIDAAENGGHAEITLEERVMPNGRYVVQVRSTDGDGEHGTSTTVRRRTLRRAVGGR